MVICLVFLLMLRIIMESDRCRCSPRVSCPTSRMFTTPSTLVATWALPQSTAWMVSAPEASWSKSSLVKMDAPSRLILLNSNPPKAASAPASTTRMTSTMSSTRRARDFFRFRGLLRRAALGSGGTGGRPSLLPPLGRGRAGRALSSGRRLRLEGCGRSSGRRYSSGRRVRVCWG